MFRAQSINAGSILDPLQAIILGFIQGVTEWLPISSTGHLRIAEHSFGLTVPLIFDVTLHLGTLIVTLLFFRKDVKNIFIAFVKREFGTEEGRLIISILIGTVPTFLLGVFFGSWLDAYFSSFLPLGGMFIVSGVAIYGSKFGKERKENIKYTEAFLVGTAQGIAIIPSISRSGITIATAILLGIKREKAFNFSFLLSIPAVVGALGLTLYEQIGTLTFVSIGLAEIFIAIAVTIVFSFLALTLLWKTIASKKFYLFAFYNWLIGITVIILGLLGF